jgi:hypothetical protein
VLDIEKMEDYSVGADVFGMAVEGTRPHSTPRRKNYRRTRNFGKGRGDRTTPLFQGRDAIRNSATSKLLRHLEACHFCSAMIERRNDVKDCFCTYWRPHNAPYPRAMAARL